MTPAVSGNSIEENSSQLPGLAPLARVSHASGKLLAAAEEGAPSCPRLIDASDSATGIVDWRLEGDCEWEDDAGQHRVEGSIVARGDRSGTEITYHGYRQTTVRASECDGQETDTGMTGVVHVPYALAPWIGSEDPPPAPGDVVDERHYDIHILFDFSGTDESCRLEKTTLAYDVTVDSKYEYVEEPYVERTLSDVQGAAASVVATREAPGEPWQTTWAGAWRMSAEGYGPSSEGEECSKRMAGTLRLESGGDVAFLQPNAPASCQCTAWSLNGEEQPEMCGFVGFSGCSAGPNAPPPWTAMFILLGGLLWQRRRRQRA